MKIIISFLLGLFLFAFAGGELFGQQRKMTFILLRHAEKDISPGADKVNPDLSEEGRERARRLVKTIKKYKPKAIYSSDFQRTRLTVAPLAEKRKIQVQTYDHRNLEELSKRLLESNEKRIVVVGHNTTTPALANLLIKQQKYTMLDESEYDKIWIIEIKKGKVKEKVIRY